MERDLLETKVEILPQTKIPISQPVKYPQSKKRNFLIIGIAALIIFLFSITLLFMTFKRDKFSKVGLLPSPTTEILPSAIAFLPLGVTVSPSPVNGLSANIPIDLNDTPELFADLTWKKIETNSDSLGKDALYFTRGQLLETASLTGQTWQTQVSQADSSVISKSFFEYYFAEFVKRGWLQHTSTNGVDLSVVAADGPTSSILGYIAHSSDQLRVAVLSEEWTDKFHTFSLFISNITPISTVLPTN